MTSNPTPQAHHHRLDRGRQISDGAVLRHVKKLSLTGTALIPLSSRTRATSQADVPWPALSSHGSPIDCWRAFHGRRWRGGSTITFRLAQQKHGSRCDPALIKAIARGRAWFEELATGHARSLQELAKRDGISRRYIRRLVGLAFLSPQLVEAILQGRQPVELTATRLTELDLPLDWTEQHKLLAS
jgi:hypothetical protein